MGSSFLLLAGALFATVFSGFRFLAAEFSFLVYGAIVLTFFEGTGAGFLTGTTGITSSSSSVISLDFMCSNLAISYKLFDLYSPAAAWPSIFFSSS